MSLAAKRRKARFRTWHSGKRPATGRKRPTLRVKAAFLTEKAETRLMVGCRQVGKAAGRLENTAQTAMDVPVQYVRLRGW